MKKQLLTIFTAVLSIASASAQDTLFVGESQTVGFGDMSTIDADADTYGWAIGDMTGAGTTFDAQGEALTSNSWKGGGVGALTPDNWVITPALDLSAYATATLTFGRSSYEVDYAGENYSVYAVVSADANAVGTALSGATALYTELIATGDEWLTKTVDLTSVAGYANVYVAFRHHDCTDMNLLTVDDIIVSADGVNTVKENNLNVLVYPNPANDVVNFKLNGNATSVEIIGLDGKVYSSTSVNGNSTSVNVSELASGIYVYEIVAENGSITRNTFVKK